MDAKIEVPIAKNPAQSNILFLKPWAGQNIALQSLSAAGNGSFPIFTSGGREGIFFFKGGRGGGVL